MATLGKRSKSSRPRDGPAELDRVLEAERTAEDAIAAEEIDAERALERARQHAREIARRAEERVTRVRTQCEESIERRLSDLRAAAEDRADRVERLGDDPARQQAAVRRVARWLVGDDDEEGEVTS